MIYARLTGGLGNQLFQLAATKKVSTLIKMDFCVCSDHLGNYERPYDFMLNDVLNDKVKNSRIPFPMGLITSYRLNKILPFLFNWHIDNKNINDFNKFANHLVLDDYFQNVNDIKDEILNLAENIQLYRLNNQIIQDAFSNLIKDRGINNCAAIHIRRADYLSKKGEKVHCYLDNNYYKKAIDLLPNNIKTVFIFSESNENELSEIINCELIYIKELNLKDTEEFLLMSFFNNIIIANSTFSFWASCTPKSNSGIKIGPKDWTFLQKENKIWEQNLDEFKFITV